MTHSVNLTRMGIEMITTMLVVGYITFTQHPRLALVTIIPAPFLAWWVNFRSTIFDKFHRKESKLNESRDQIGHESVGNIREVSSITIGVIMLR